MSIKELNYQAPLNPLGYGVVGKNILYHLTKAGVKVNLWPIGGVQVDEPEIIECINKGIRNREEINNLHSTSLRIWHEFDLAQHVGKGNHVGFPIFETNVPSDAAFNSMRMMDRICVCSDWARRVINDTFNNVNVSVVPLGVDRNIFNENAGEPDDKWFTFINIGKWEYRKGHDVIIKAFERAFHPRDRVRLWMMNHNPFLSPEATFKWINLYRDSPMAHRVALIPQAKSHADVARIMCETDCGVFPARAEGWNLELLEMMSCGKQVITTDYSGNTEFCNEDNAYLVPVNAYEKIYDGIFFTENNVHPDATWANLDEREIDIVAEYMSQAYENGSKLNTAGIETAKQFSWENTVNTLIGELYA